MKRLFSILLLALLWRPASATTNTAASVSFADVSAANALCNDGDTLLIPAGSGDWTQTLQVTKAITILGSGMTQTIITDDVPQSGNVDSQSIFTLQTTSDQTKFWRVTNLQIAKGSRTTQGTKGAIRVRGSSQQFRIDHIQFEKLNQTDIVTLDWPDGCIDSCFFDDDHNISILTQHSTWNNIGAFGDSSWASPINLGSSNAVYIEANVFNCSSHDSVCDGSQGGRFVLRYNLITNNAITWHGTETGGRERGTRSYEIYFNTNVCTVSQPHAIGIMRSGSGVVWSNAFFGPFQNAIFPVEIRDAFTAPFWGLANGLNGWDLNSGSNPFFTGTVASQAGYCQVVINGASFSANQWTGYTIWNAAEARCGVITSNTLNTVYYLNDSHDGETLTNQPGDTVTFNLILHALDMVGSGQCDLLSGSSPSPVWLHQGWDTTWAWGNTWQGTNVTMISVDPLIIEGQSFSNAPLSYTPLPYPHQLRNLGPAPFPVSIVVQPQNTSAYITQQATFSVVADDGGSQVIGYQWFKSGNLIAGATLASYTTPPVFIANAGDSYTVYCSNSVNIVTSTPALLFPQKTPWQNVYLQGKIYAQ